MSASPAPAERLEARRSSGEDAERFAATVAHDLEGSLLVISNGVSLLREAPGGLSSEQAEHVDRIARTVERMRQLTAGVRYYSRSDAVLDLDQVPLGSALEDVLETLAPLIAERRTEIELPAELPLLIADRTQLVQLLQNLIANAVKFGPRLDGSVMVAVARVPGAWRVAVSDQGPGIAPEDRERIFEPFERLPAGRREPGTGLGLAICRRVAENHGGSLTVDPARGGGATFAFTLPDRTPVALRRAQ
jgi:signal transduction histidine kinase